MNVGDLIPDVSFKATQGLDAHFADYRGQWLVLYFYPKDATPGCTIEGQNFRDHYAAFTALNTVILGVSRDTLACHERFKAKQGFPFELIDDKEEVLCSLFDVIRSKSMFGKQVRGIVRSTFIINPEGILVHSWRKVTVAGHVEEVLSTLKKLQGMDK